MIATIWGNAYRLTIEGISADLYNVKPDPIQQYYVLVNGKRYPVNQVLEHATKLTRVECKTVYSVPILSRLGYKIYRI